MEHGSIKHRLSWQRPLQPAEIPSLTILFFEGLKETKHPYTFLVTEGLVELFRIDGMHLVILNDFQKLTSLAKLALSSLDTVPFKINIDNKIQDVFQRALKATELLFTGITDLSIAACLLTLLVPIGRRFTHPKTTALVRESLNQIEKTALHSLRIGSLIKQKIPTYNAIHP